jgi:hypothetical protein
MSAENTEPVVDDPNTPEDEAAVWAASVAENNRDGLRGGAAAPEGVGGPFEHDTQGDETEDEPPVG